jgi:hydrogenase/urease accessory protein HupE
MKRSLRLLLLSLAACWSAHLSAHEMTMAELELREGAKGEFLWTWVANERPVADELSLRWPDACRADEAVLHCGQAGLRGTLEVKGVGKSFSAALVKVYWLDGQSRVYALTSAQPEVQLFGSADDQRGMGELARAYTILGVEHILTGYDHLAFVLALLFLVGFNKRLLLTITAFTAAHSLTLALSALGLLTLRPPPVEATIALSIMLVAGEALHKGATLSKRWPAVVAFIFGLVHGLGFAGALKEIGLPQKHLAVALVTFNVGVEFGQLLVVAIAFAAYRTLASQPKFTAARTPALYTIGGVAAYWSISRITAMLM